MRHHPFKQLQGVDFHHSHQHPPRANPTVVDLRGARGLNRYWHVVKELIPMHRNESSGGRHGHGVTTGTEVHDCHRDIKGEMPCNTK